MIQALVTIKRMKCTVSEEFYERGLLYKEALDPSKEAPPDQTSASFKTIYTTTISESLLRIPIVAIHQLTEHSKTKPSQCNSHSQCSSSRLPPPPKTGHKEATTTNNPQTTSPLHQEEPTHPVLLKATKAEAGPTSQPTNRLLRSASSRPSRRPRLMTGARALMASC